MKEINFRIIELPTHQILLMRDFDNEADEDDEILSIIFFLDGVKVDFTLNYTDEEPRDKAFFGITEERAQGFLDNYSKTRVI